MHICSTNQISENLKKCKTKNQQLTQEERLAIEIPDTMIRISIGLEDIDDLIEDMDQALSKIG
jgi:cystathionine beta-lyase/cystathionine gamma-synthase